MSQIKLKNPRRIKFIIFDIGGVLWESNDPALFEAMAKDLGLNPQDVERAIEGIRDLSTNTSISEEETLKRIMEELRIPKARREIFERSFDQSEIYKPIPKMQDLVRDLSQNPIIEIYLLSDIVNIGSFHRSVLEALAKYYPSIRQDHILFSSRIKASKRETGAKAFRVLLERLGIDDPSTVVFIDDVQKYVDNAREVYRIQSINPIPDPSQERTPAKMLRSVFAEAGLI